MSLDVWLTAKESIKKSGTGVFIRENGKRIELTVEQVKEKWPDAEISPQEYKTSEVYEGNITHNLGRMAKEAFIYYALWRPDEKGWTHARDLIRPLEKGLAKLKAKPDRYKRLNPEDGWGNYDNLVEFVTEYLEACKKYPDAEIGISR